MSSYVPTVYAAPTPRCALSISPEIIKKGENANWYLKVTGPVDKVVYTVDGILKYTGGSVYDISSFPPDSINYRDREGFETGPTKIRPMSIGTGSETIYVYGPGGSNSCTASIKVIANDLYDESKTIIFTNPATYHLGGSEKFRACPSFSCGTTVWGTTNGNATINKKNGDWYFASIVEEYVKGHPYNTSGWLPSNLVPDKVKQRLQDQNPNAFAEEEKKEATPGTIQENGPKTKNPLLQFIAPMEQWFGKKEIIYPFLTILAVILFYLAYYLFRKIKLSVFIHKVKLIKFSRTHFVISVIILGFISFGSFGFIIYRQNQQVLKTTNLELAKTQQEIQSLKTLQEKTFSKQQSLLEEQNSQLQQSHQNEEAAKQALQELQNRPSQTNGRPTGAFLTKFSQSVVKMLCFADSYSDNMNQGTAVLYKTSGQSALAPFYIQTNLHVVLTDDNSTSSCIIVLYPDYSNSNSYLLFKSTGYRFFKNYIDTAFVKVEIVDDATIPNRGSIQDLNLYAQAESETYYCSDVKIGDPLSVFGYPAIGGKSLTLTDGIISGVETDNNGVRYYKTSAKIDHGNSGGVAIGDSGCVIGIPTFVQQGELESIGRILDLKYVFDSLR